LSGPERHRNQTDRRRLIPSEVCLAMSTGADSQAGLTTLKTIQKIRSEMGVNLTIGASNVSFGLPDRKLLNSAFLAIAIAYGVNCPIVDAAKVQSLVLAADLSMGCDDYAVRYTEGYRKRITQIIKPNTNKRES
jgi:5-methyltetrahydrofolate--homocysteine methyltransferase